MAKIEFLGDDDILESVIFEQAALDFQNLTAGFSPDIRIALYKNKDFTNTSNIDSSGKYSGFEWSMEYAPADGKFLTLHASSYKGFANGIYALLQEKLGFRFYHCREMIVPANKTVDWYNLVPFSGKPVFEKMGFHIHSMHPLELTENLLDETTPNALANVKEYIDWLARNGQNYFEFNLLESINRDGWIAHAKAITDYAHSRGIFCGIDLSLHMIQQKAFQLYAGKLNEDKKIQKNTEWLLPANFDIWNVELSTTEFSQGDQQKKKKQIELLSGILEKHGVRLFSRAHVVKPDKMVSGNDVLTNENILGPKHGLMVHSVMFYSLNDSAAPVYENKNLWHMRDMLLAEKEKRETWYYPESAYWITFDNSVPMLLLPYLKARLDDINYCEQEKVIGHCTFSSGWEWGYWLIDWSIARWCWNYTEDGMLKEKSPLQYVSDISSNQNFIDFVKQAADLQQKYIKDEELIRVMVPTTITDEISGKFNLVLEPRPKYSYKYIRNDASLEELEYVKKNYLDKLEEFGLYQLNQKQPDWEKLNSLEKELVSGIEITYLRANHRYFTLSYIVGLRKQSLTHKNAKLDFLLSSSEIIRIKALKIVEEQEAHYRYPVELLSYPHYSHTAYHHGYLYTTHDLHFWEREEMQAKKNKYRFWYMNIWNIGRIIGLVN